MSGRKYSSYQFNKEQQDRNQLVNQSQSAKRRIAALLAEIKRQTQALAAEDGASDGAVRTASAWSKVVQTDPAIHRSQAFGDPLALLAKESQRLERIEMEGIERSRELTLALVRRRIARRKAESEAALAQEKLTRNRVDRAVNELSRLLTEMNPGLEESFPAEAAALRQAAERLTGSHNDRGAQSEAALAGAAAASTAWNSAMEKAQEIKARAQSRIGEAEAAFARNRERLQASLGGALVSDIERALAAVREALNQDRLAAVNQESEELSQRLRRNLEECEKLEDLRQRRQFVATSLVKACEQLGFGVVEPLRLEDPNDLRSPMRLKVDTFDEGQITFRITLDSIESDSCISKSYCFGEFDRLSKHLSRQFGISTKFGMADGSPRPKDRAQGELDEPSGHPMTAGKG